MQVFLIAAISKDGFIAKDPKEPSTNWTSNADKKWFNQKTREAGAVVMGRKTYETIDKKWRPLPDRLNIIYSREAQNSDLENLEYTQASPRELITKLEQQGFKQVAICGGASIYTMFLNSGLLDKLFLTVEEDVEFGKGIGLFNDGTTLDDKKFKLANETKLSDKTRVLEYDLVKTN